MKKNTKKTIARAIVLCGAFAIICYTLYETLLKPCIELYKIAGIVGVLFWIFCSCLISVLIYGLFKLIECALEDD